MYDYSKEYEFAVSLARDCGEMIKTAFFKGVSAVHKTDGSLLTEIDTAVNQHVIDRISAMFPAHNILGEEQSMLGKPSSFTWICDPIDGTKPFAYGIPVSIFSIALCVDGVPVLGINYDPYLGHLFHAQKGKGAFRNDDPIHVNNANELNRKLVIAFSGGKYNKYDHTGFIHTILQQSCSVVNLGSGHYMGNHVAKGDYGAFIMSHYTTHDVAALKIIVEEAGGKVTDLLGQEQRYDQSVRGALVSNSVLHDRLLQIIAETITF